MTDDPTLRLQGFFGDEGERALAPRDRIGRYELQEEIGRGGMAIVYKARDPELDRIVAIKVLKDGPSERLHREASAAAKLRHPNVVTIHEVGPDYIVMEWVAGQTLSRALVDRPLRERIAVLETVARAVDYAHTQGVVHRDLKPDNVLLEPGGRVVLTDFGLAKTLGADALTQSGTALGTPHYMSPEQVRGETARIGPASDVWALGVMLFEMASGGVPFPGASLAVVYDAVQREEPPSLSRGLAPLGAVVGRALEKNPAHRYPSAGAFADDLRRYLDGQPVSVEQAGPVTRLVRRVRRRPARWAVAAGGLVAAAALFGLALSGRAARDRVVESVRTQARLSLQAALELRRAGAIGRMRQFLPPLEAAYREAILRAPALPEPDYLMGRMQRALLDEPAALSYQSQALRKDPRYAPALYERALLLSLQQGRALDAAAAPAELTPPGSNELARLKPQPALIERGRAAVAAWEAYFSTLPTGTANDPTTHLARGLSLYAGGRRDDLPAARAELERAVKADPSLEEGWETLGRAVFLDRLGFNNRAELMDQEREARLSESIARDRGYEQHYLERGRLRFQRGSMKRHSGRDPNPDYNAAAADFSAAIAIAPRDPVPWFWRGRMAIYRAIWGLENDRDPRPELDAADADIARAIEVDANAASVWLWRGNARLYRGIYSLAHGLPAVAALERARADLTHALALDPGEREALMWRTRTCAQLGAAQARAGIDPTATFAAGMRDFSTARAPDPDHTWTLLWGSELWSERARYRYARGEDARDDYDTAKALLDRAVADRNQMETWKHRGLLQFDRARALVARGNGREARALYAAASADFQQALELNPVLVHQIGEQADEARRKALGLDDGAGRRKEPSP